MKGMYFIGGAGASGKTVAAKQLARESGLPLVELDRCVLPLLRKHDKNTSDEDKMIVFDIIWETVQGFLKLDACFLAECGWMEPDKAAVLRARSNGRFYPVFCGYTDSTIEKRYEKIQADDRHWLTIYDDTFAREFLKRQTVESKQRKALCERKKIPYFDFTDFDNGHALLSNDFSCWRSSLL